MDKYIVCDVVIPKIRLLPSFLPSSLLLAFFLHYSLFLTPLSIFSTRSTVSFISLPHHSLTSPHPTRFSTLPSFQIRSIPMQEWTTTKRKKRRKISITDSNVQRSSDRHCFRCVCIDRDLRGVKCQCSDGWG